MSLHRKISSLGPLTGRTMEEISAVCGAPRNVYPHRFSDVGDGAQAVWRTPLFSFGLNFDGEERCCGIYFTHDLAPYVTLLAISVAVVGGLILLLRLL